MLNKNHFQKVKVTTEQHAFLSFKPTKDKYITATLTDTFYGEIKKAKQRNKMS